METSTENTSLENVRPPILQIRSNPFFFEKRRLRSYRENVTTRGIEEVCAALARIETILRCLGYSSASSASLESSARGMGASEPSYYFLKNLLALMEREPALRPYLQRHKRDDVDASSDALAAWAAASGDAAFFLSLRERDWAPRYSRYVDLAKLVIVPAIFIVLTAFLGNWIATDLQREAFKHQKTFDVRLSGLQEGQDRSAELYASLTEIYSTIADLEEAKVPGLQPNKLRALRQKLDSIHAASRLYDSDNIVGSAMVDAETVLDKYIECLNEKSNNEKRPLVTAVSINCSEQHKNILPVFDKILDAHTFALEKLVNSES